MIALRNSIQERRGRPPVSNDLKAELRKTDSLFEKMLDSHEKRLHACYKRAGGTLTSSQLSGIELFLSDSRSTKSSFHKAIKRIYSKQIKLAAIPSKEQINGALTPKQEAIQSNLQEYLRLLRSTANVFSMRHDYEGFMAVNSGNNALLYAHFKLINTQNGEGSI